MESDESESQPAMFAVVKTKTDERHGWVAAGHSIGRLRLQAHALGLGCSVRPDAMRNPWLRAELRRGFGHKGFVQAIARFQPSSLRGTHPSITVNSPVAARQQTSRNSINLAT
jgi:hypothetical protein